MESKFHQNFKEVTKFNHLILILPFLLFLLAIGPIEYFVVILVIVTFVYLIVDNKFRFFDIDFFLLFAFTFSYNLLNKATVNTDFGILTFIQLSIFPSIFYFFGKYLSSKIYSGRLLLFIVLFFIGSFTIIPLVSILISIVKNGFMVTREINLLFPTGDETIAATILSSFFALNMSFFPFLFLKFENSWEKKIGLRLGIFFIIGLICVANLISRTGFVISIYTYLVFLIVIPFKFKFSFLTKTIAVLTILTFLTYISGLVDFIMESELYFRFFLETDSEDGLASDRSKIWEEAWDILTNGNNARNDHELLESVKYAHNLWLDVALKSGFIPFIINIVFVVKFCLNVFKFYINSPNLLTKLIYLAISFSFLLTFMVEPIMDGYFILFCFFSFFAGIVKWSVSSEYNLIYD